MFSKKMEDAFNAQINAEFYSEYLYLAMKAHFEELHLTGIANWFGVQVQEEHAHGLGMYDYVHERGGKVTLGEIAKPEIKGKDTVAIFEQVLEHEQLVTSKINALVDVAEAEHDRAALSFLDWYIKEQVEEESNVRQLIATLKLIGEDKKALLMLDRELAARTYTAPVIG
ncbi:ferritin [Candidatus Avelusimicrobium alvi]|uniref:ferritin n=1 Tax=Candidatus Avelusimicrobium alvi TaxID=3416221 RepID=UPI003D13621E